MNITDLTEAQQQECLVHSQDLVRAQGWDPKYYTGLQVALTRGYTLYQRGINLLTEQGLVEISDISVLVQALIQPFRRTWIIYPLGIEKDFNQIPVLREQR